jgi:hypothetical protein
MDSKMNFLSEHFEGVLTIIITIGSVIFGLIKFLFYQEKNHIDKQFERIDEEICSLRECLQETRENFVTKTDLKDAVERIIESNRDIESRLRFEISEKADKAYCTITHQLHETKVDLSKLKKGKGE